MNNFIDYFYNIGVEKVLFNGKYYSFIYNGYLYRIYPVDNNLNINMIVNINKRLLGHTLISEVIPNKDGNYITFYNDQNYLLIRVYANVNKKISLEEISYLANSLYTQKLKVNWGLLWSKKIDYLEELINENGKKYPIIVNSFNYFVGMAENAISYFNDIKIEDDYKYAVSHKNIRFKDTLDVLYNPLNIIFDYRARDIAEYIKNAFFINNKNIYNELNQYIINNSLSLIDAKLVVARLMYPSFYFEMYEDILINDASEKIIVPIINRLPEYEKYLARMINYFRNFYNIPIIPWLNNNYEKKNED